MKSDHQKSIGNRVTLKIYLCIMCYIVSFSSAIAETNNKNYTVTYLVPEGFSAAEMDDDAQYLASFDGTTLPDYISYSTTKNQLVFNEKKYLANGIPQEKITQLQRVLQKFNYQECSEGCDQVIDGLNVSLDKSKRIILIHDESLDYLIPQTSFGLINNQSVEILGSSNHYHAVNLTANTWIGLPSQTFAHIDWSADMRQQKGSPKQNVIGISSWYLQKNFTKHYVRAGKINSLDDSSGSINTTLHPSFNQFITIGSQSNMSLKQENEHSGSIVLYAGTEGHYEIIRDNRLLLRKSAVLGRNEISYQDLPNGYYSVEIRLIDRNGHIISHEPYQVNNLTFGDNQENYFATVGTESSTMTNTLQLGASHNFQWLFVNSSLLLNQYGQYASEVNLYRPSTLGQWTIDPVIGLLKGEKHDGKYINLGLSHSLLGYISFSHYFNNDVSAFYRNHASTSLSYSRSFWGTILAYSYGQYLQQHTHRITASWSYTLKDLLLDFSVSIERSIDSYTFNNQYGIFLNSTLKMQDVDANLNTAYIDSRLQLSGEYQKELDDNFGSTILGVNASQLDNTANINLFANRNSTRGTYFINLGRSNNQTNFDLTYNGMLVLNRDNLAFGRYNPNGSALIVEMPENSDKEYGFQIEGVPVTNHGVYAIPIKPYENLSFAHAQIDIPDVDMNVEIPASVIKAHPGQAYTSKARIELNLSYNGFLVDQHHQPINGTIQQTGDTVYPNGLFSIFSDKVLKEITVKNTTGEYICDLTHKNDNYYTCKHFT